MLVEHIDRLLETESLTMRHNKFIEIKMNYSLYIILTVQLAY